MDFQDKPLDDEVRPDPAGFSGIRDLNADGTDYMIERLRRKQDAARHIRRTFFVVTTAVSTTWIVGGLLLFGMDWFQNTSESLLTGFAFGALMGLCIAAYIFWLEFRGALEGKTAVWNIRGVLSPQPALRSVVRLKVQFAVLTLVICGLVGACLASAFVVMSNAQAAPRESAILVGAALVAAVIAFWLTGKDRKRVD